MPWAGRFGVLTGPVSLLVELLLRAMAGVVGKVLLGRDAIVEAAGSSWSAWPVVGLVAVMLVVGAWTAFWDD